MKKAWKRITQQEYIDRASKVHSNFYDYSNAKFITVNDKIEILCPTHGVFWQNAHNHLQGNKCKKCAMEERSKNRTKSTAQFIVEANTVHDNYYDYTKTVYTKSSNKIIITCPIHGDFEQQANSHIRGAQCSSCARVGSNYGWSYTNWEEAGKHSKEFEGYSLYILKCFSATEIFYKIGKTFVNIRRRYECVAALPYTYLIVDQIYGDARTISELESYMHKTLKKDRYTPTVKFAGETECFNYIPYTIIKELLHAYTPNTDDSP